MGTRTGEMGQRWHSPPYDLKKMTPYADLLRNALKFSLAPSALAINDSLEFSLKQRKKQSASEPRIVGCANYQQGLQLIV